jgi:hypothetical protein
VERQHYRPVLPAMKTRLLFAPLFLCFWPLLFAQQVPAPEPRPPVVFGLTPAEPAPITDNQKIYNQPMGNVLLVPPEVLNGVIAKFRDAFAAPGAPRIVIYVNRELVDTTSGLKLTGHTEQYEKTDNSTKTSGVNTYAAIAAPVPTLADKQTVRDIERLFGRVFRSAGAKLADQKTAVDLLADQPGLRLLGDQAAKEREALSGIADIAIEVLISSRNLTVPGVSGDQVLAVPDIQATAIRLKDAAIIGQSSASDVLGKGASVGQLARTFDVRDITEATSIALMQDMLLSAK